MQGGGFRLYGCLLVRDPPPNGWFTFKSTKETGPSKKSAHPHCVGVFKGVLTVPLVGVVLKDKQEEHHSFKGPAATVC